MYHDEAFEVSSAMGRPKAAVFVFAVAMLGGCARPTPVERALSLFRQHHEEQAAAVLQEKVDRHPQNAEAHGLLIRTFGSLGDIGRAKKAAEVFRQQLPPESPAAAIELGRAYELAHRFEEALASYDEAADRVKASPVGPREGGLRAARWGLVTEADERLREALRRGADDTEVLHALGLVSIQLDRFDDAAKYYRRCIGKGSPECYLGLASLGLRRDDYALALEGFDGVLRLRPHYADASLGRAFALIRLGRFAEAEQELSRAEQLGAAKGPLSKQRVLLQRFAQAKKSRGTNPAAVIDDGAPASEGPTKP